MRNVVQTFLCICLSVVLISCSRSDLYITITGFAQGGTYAVKINMKGVDRTPEEVRDTVDLILRDIDNSLSGYNKKSLVSRFNAGETIVPDSHFKEIYALSMAVYETTEGAVDVASAPLFDIWGFGFANDSLPSPDQVRLTMTSCGMGRLKSCMDDVIAPDGSLRPEDLLKEPGVLPELNFNAIAQGYSSDVVARYLYSIGVKDMLVDIGEIFCDGVNPSGHRWTVGIDRPEDGNDEPGSELQGIFQCPQGPHGIVTSGNYRKFYIRDGKKYAHTIDPRTGYPVGHNLLSATILGPDAAMADAYATYCMVIGLEASRDFLLSSPELEGCLVYDQDGEFRIWCSDGFSLKER